ncbi:MAG: DUF4043 family protein [Candidatus Dojkabacteria bacterium]|jgi:hypothetical protein|nr:DUF4043 family protein [Candidatus Dojkabacteria bacterium]
MPEPQLTGVVSIGSELERKRWIREGLIKNASKSFWSPYTGNSFESIVYQVNDPDTKAGHNVVFQFDGYLVEGPVKGKETARGKGEEKKLFSDKCIVDRYRFPVSNGDIFDGVNVGDLSITQHADSREKLADKFVRFKDQAIFDVAQQSVTHKINLSAFGMDNILDVEQILKTGTGYSVGGKRLPLKPFRLSDGRPVWLWLLDPLSKVKFLKSTGAQNLLKDADVRGNANRTISGLIGKIGNFLFVEADVFFGSQKGNTILDALGYSAINDIKELHCAGLRTYKATTDFTPASWLGYAGYDAASGTVHSRNLILGAGAIQVPFGKMPDYKFELSQDFAIDSESALEVWMNVKATSYYAENKDYLLQAGGITNGIIAVDVKH